MTFIKTDCTSFFTWLNLLLCPAALMFLAVCLLQPNSNCTCYSNWGYDINTGQYTPPQPGSLPACYNPQQDRCLFRALLQGGAAEPSGTCPIPPICGPNGGRKLQASVALEVTDAIGIAATSGEGLRGTGSATRELQADNLQAKGDCNGRWDPQNVIPCSSTSPSGGTINGICGSDNRCYQVCPQES